MRSSAGETILRFGRVVAFFAVGIWFPCRYVSYSISILDWKAILQTIVSKGVRAKEAPEVWWDYCMKRRAIQAEQTPTSLTVEEEGEKELDRDCIVLWA